MAVWLFPNLLPNVHYCDHDDKSLEVTSTQKKSSCFCTCPYQTLKHRVVRSEKNGHLNQFETLHCQSLWDSAVGARPGCDFAWTRAGETSNNHCRVPTLEAWLRVCRLTQVCLAAQLELKDRQIRGNTHTLTEHRHTLTQVSKTKSNIYQIQGKKLGRNEALPQI